MIESPRCASIDRCSSIALGVRNAEQLINRRADSLQAPPCSWRGRRRYRRRSSVSSACDGTNTCQVTCIHVRCQVTCIHVRDEYMSCTRLTNTQANTCQVKNKMPTLVYVAYVYPGASRANPSRSDARVNKCLLAAPRTYRLTIT